MTDDEIVKALECCSEDSSDLIVCNKCPLCNEIGCIDHLRDLALDLINRQQTEIEKLKDEVAKARSKALLEAFSKFAGHSDYHGDTILCVLSCMTEGKEVRNATPLDSSKIKADTVKDFVERLKENISDDCHIVSDEGEYVGYDCADVINCIDNLIKEMESDDNA